jgi:hypothetical protein
MGGQAIATSRDFEEARVGQWSQEVLKLGEALAAYECAAHGEAVPILIRDELDKIGVKIGYVITYSKAKNKTERISAMNRNA